MEAGVEPGLQSGLGIVQVDVGDADLGKSQFMCPDPQLLREPLQIDVVKDAWLHLHAPILESRSQIWPDEAACAACATALAARPALRDAYVALHGGLGAGKTTFVRHLLRALGQHGRIRSPSYAVLEPYSLPGLEISHFDFYRFADPREWEDAGFRELFGAPGLKLAEWPEKAAALLPAPDLELSIGVDDDERRQVRFDARSARGVALLP